MDLVKRNAEIVALVKARKLPMREIAARLPSQHLLDFADCHPAWRSRSGCRPEKGAGGEQADPTRDAIEACCPDRRP